MVICTGGFINFLPSSGASSDRPRLTVEISTRKSGGGTAVLVALADTGVTTSFLTRESTDRVRLCISETDIAAGCRRQQEGEGESYCGGQPS